MRYVQQSSVTERELENEKKATCEKESKRAQIREALASGEWLDVAEPSLAEDRLRAQTAMQRFNTELALDEEARMDELRRVFGAVGAGTTVMPGVHVDYGYNIFMGENCFFNYNTTFLDGAPITFGDDVWVGPGCHFCTPLHPLLGRERATRFDEDGTPHLQECNLPITVGSDVWIAAGVIVNPGVTIGDGAVIGSGSVVTKDIPPRMIAFGNPCRPVREITEDDSIESMGVF